MPRFCFLGVALFCLILLRVGLSPAEAADESRLDLVKQRGTLIVGVKTDYPPFGKVDSNGALIGLEPDLAADLAHSLGVQLKLVGVSSANRLQKLEEGSIDVLIATLGDTASRRDLADLIEPNYYASGVTIMMPKSRHVKNWADLRGQPVCTTQGAYFNPEMAQRYLLNLQFYNGTRDAQLAMRDGHCVGWIYDDTAIAAALAEPEWADYTQPLPSTLVLPWSIAIARSERGSAFERIISDTIGDWHRSGHLLEVEARWISKPSQFLHDTNILWNTRDSATEYVCTRGSDGQWPAECRNKNLLRADDVGGLQRVGMMIKERFGLDLTPVYEPYDRGLFVRGIINTIGLVLTCIIGSLVVALAGVRLAESGVPFAGAFVSALSTFGRMTPPLLQIYVVLGGIGTLLSSHYGLTLNPFFIVSLCLCYYTGSAGIVALRDGVSVLKKRDPNFRFRFARLSQLLPLAYGPLISGLINVVKATGMASAFAVPELINSSTAIIAERGNTAVMMNLLMITYFILVLIVVHLFGRIERSLKNVFH